MKNFKIATWNVNSLKVRLPHVLEWADLTHPDIIAIQETKTQDQNFPLEEINAAGYNVVFSGQKTYNGTAILSKGKTTDVITDIPGLDDPQRRILIATINDVRVVNLYVPNGSNVGSEKYEYKLDWLKKITNYIKEQLKEFPRLVVLGDFNIAPEDRDVYDPKAWEGNILVSDPERKAFRKLISVGLVDSFRLFDKSEKSYSWWDYRMHAFHRDMGLRLDHILISQNLEKCCTGCEIDKNPRKWERPSDHTPVIASFELS